MTTRWWVVAALRRTCAMACAGAGGRALGRAREQPGAYGAIYLAERNNLPGT
jgi:hypothetical protein